MRNQKLPATYINPTELLKCGCHLQRSTPLVPHPQLPWSEGRDPMNEALGREQNPKLSSFKGYQLGLGFTVEQFMPKSTVKNNIAISKPLVEPNSWMCSEEDLYTKCGLPTAEAQ